MPSKDHKYLKKKNFDGFSFQLHFFRSFCIESGSNGIFLKVFFYCNQIQWIWILLDNSWYTMEFIPFLCHLNKERGQ